MGTATLTAEAVLLLMMIGISGIWLILDQIARVLQRGRAAIALREEVARLVAEQEAAAENDSAAIDSTEHEPLRAAA